MKLNIVNVERALLSEFVQRDENGEPFVYVETGTFKPYSIATVTAARRRGHRVVKRMNGVYRIYAKPYNDDENKAAFDATMAAIANLIKF